MRKLVAAFAASAFLLLTAGKCEYPGQTTTAVQATIDAASATSPKLAAASVAVNAKIAQASARLAQYCTLARVSLGGASLFGSSTGAIAAARTVVADFCDAPPADPVSAYALVQAAVSDLKAAGITPQSVQHLSLHQARYAKRRLIRLHLAAQQVR